ncbi:hypothetical protein Gotur_028287, partial [Gossypium turneri]
VLELIGNLTRTWKVEVVEDTFSKVDAGKILRIPLIFMEHEDLLVWMGEPSSEFLVSSGYKLLLNSTTDPTTIELKNDMKSFYRKIWNLKLTTK